MKELNDTDFDKAFKTRITEELPEFEEESWLKMERKLSKRDRFVFLRFASILLVLLSFGIGFYLLNKNGEDKVDAIVSKKIENNGNKTTDIDVKPLTKPKELETVQHNNPSNSYSYQAYALKDQSPKTQPTYNVSFNHDKLNQKENVVIQNPSIINSTKTHTIADIQPANQIAQNVIANSAAGAIKIDTPLAKSKTEIAIKAKKRTPISVAIVAGPDFSSTGAIVSGKTGVFFGATIAIGLTKKLSVQTGISYGSKNYSSSAYDYSFSNPNANKANFSGIEATCEVLEIPLRASYNISENSKRSIELNAGLSSYLMVKENYVFKYKDLNRANRITEVANKNQHYLSVIDLSATYNIKLKNKNFAFGIEPYAKIPLTGIGEGSVPLKSSGVSLKLRYDFNKN